MDQPFLDGDQAISNMSLAQKRHRDVFGVPMPLSQTIINKEGFYEKTAHPKFSLLPITGTGLTKEDAYADLFKKLEDNWSEEEAKPKQNLPVETKEPNQKIKRSSFLRIPFKTRKNNFNSPR